MTLKRRIFSIEAKHLMDYGTYTSRLGEYSEHANGSYAIDRQHLTDCPRFWANDDIPDDAQDCDCGNIGSPESRYFNPPAENYKGKPAADIRRCCLRAYERLQSLNNDDWYYIGIRAEAEVGISQDGGKNYLTQSISSSGLWGIESDSEQEYLTSVDREELNELKSQLLAFGFGRTAVAKAIKAAIR